MLLCFGSGMQRRGIWQVLRWRFCFQCQQSQFVSLVTTNYFLNLICAWWVFSIGLVHFGDDVSFTEQVIFLLILELNFGASEFWEKNLVADFHPHRDVFSFLEIILIKRDKYFNNLLLTWFLAPGPTAMTVPFRTFDCAFSGMTIPPAVFVNASALKIRTRSSKGINFFAMAAWW